MVIGLSGVQFGRESDLFITSMITDRIGRHEDKNYSFREKSLDYLPKYLNHRINKITTVFQNIVFVKGKKKNFLHFENSPNLGVCTLFLW